ncbi:hypothetical protein GGR50DRAFT_675876 [Xylaria sp. CBS 124048]|nr:hypothetical protein GGR50DRAFT_675876 [Xylaria sp. CBS 124048]
MSTAFSNCAAITWSTWYNGPKMDPPTVSPYARPVTFHFADGPALTAPFQAVKKSLRLAFYCGASMKLDLPDISGDVGHVLVHYLFTDTYNCLPQKDNVAEYEVSVQAYVMAWKLQLLDLVCLARKEIEKVGSLLSAAQKLGVLGKAYTKCRANDVWFQNYLMYIIQSVDGDLSNSEAHLLLSVKPTFLVLIVRMSLQLARASKNGLDGTEKPAAPEVESNSDVFPSQLHFDPPSSTCDQTLLYAPRIEDAPKSFTTVESNTPGSIELDIMLAHPQYASYSIEELRFGYELRRSLSRATVVPPNVPLPSPPNVPLSGQQQPSSPFRFAVRPEVPPFGGQKYGSSSGAANQSPEKGPSVLGTNSSPVADHFRVADWTPAHLSARNLKSDVAVNTKSKESLGCFTKKEEVLNLNRKTNVGYTDRQH